ncbi:hypothetical protein RJT34_07747 [Clitoria ternatea]|uniref:Uncharacterized protein n=1 Tax=Clitoria ternatea TaxID=43366 RepID=A0AAN9PSD7_CLITE
MWVRLRQGNSTKGLRKSKSQAVEDQCAYVVQRVWIMRKTLKLPVVEDAEYEYSKMLSGFTRPENPDMVSKGLVTSKFRDGSVPIRFT